MYIFIIIAIVILLMIVSRFLFGSYKSYNSNVSLGYNRIQDYEGRVITETDIRDLPQQVQNYLNFVGVIGQKMPVSFELVIDGQMRFDETKDWAAVGGSQLTFLDSRTRLFYITMRMFGVPINGFHNFEAGKASMVIKILDIFKIVEHKGEIMNHAETVTYFNDICLFAPAALIDSDIEWEVLDEHSVLAHFTSDKITISATLYFNEEGQLVNFISDDRYAIEQNGEYKQVRWSTPIYEYKNYNGYNLIASGEAIWHYDDYEFHYIRLNLKELRYK